MPPPVASSRVKIEIPRLTSEIGLDAPKNKPGSKGLDAESYTFMLSSFFECWEWSPLKHIKEGHVTRIACSGLWHESIADMMKNGQRKVDRPDRPVEITPSETRVVSGQVRHLVRDFLETKTKGNPQRLLALSRAIIKYLDMGHVELDRAAVLQIVNGTMNPPLLSAALQALGRVGLSSDWESASRHLRYPVEEVKTVALRTCFALDPARTAHFLNGSIQSSSE